MALLLPFTYTMDPVLAIVHAGLVYIGAEYGGSIPAILIRTPGTNSAAATVIDGYEMNGRAAPARRSASRCGRASSAACSASLMLVLLTEPLSWLALPSSRPPISASAFSASASSPR